MEQRKTFPILETQFSDLIGVLVSNRTGSRLDIKGSLSIESQSSAFVGKVANAIDTNVNYDLELKDQSDRVIFCRNCAVSKIEVSGVIRVRLEALDMSITKGQIDSEDEVEGYQILRINKFCGADFDEHGVRTINALDFLSPGARLYSVAFDVIPDSGGYLYYPTKMKDVQNFDDNIVPKLCWLLSFASGNLVDAPYQVIWKNPDNYIVRFFSSSHSKEGRGILHLARSGIVLNYLKRAWGAWDTLIGKLNLPVLIHYYALIQNQQFSEIQMLLGSIWMESIKHQFALNIQGYQQNRNGFFLKPGNSRNCYKFKDLVEQVYTHFQVSSGDLSFIDYRNEVVHQGQIDLPPQDLDQQFEILLDTIERVLLNALEYEGLVWDRLSKQWKDYT